jgi:hypothetical protein
MKPRDLMFIFFVVLVVGGLYFLSTRGKAKALPASPPEHLTAETREECLACHRSEQMAALEQQHKHPGKWRDERVSCLLCHGPAEKAAGAPFTDSSTLARAAGRRLFQER